MMQGSNRLKLLDLVLVTHYHGSPILFDWGPDYLHYSSEAADYFGFLNQLPAMPRHIAEIARARSNSINHNVVASLFCTIFIATPLYRSRTWCTRGAIAISLSG